LKDFTSIFDFFLIDGNHEADYLKREIETADKLLKLGGLLILMISLPSGMSFNKLMNL